MIAFGPVPSRRLGRSLGINNIPPKICSYSCVYCQLGRTVDMRVDRSVLHPAREIVAAVSESVTKAREADETIDYLTFVPDGEPTLDIQLGEEIGALQPLGCKIAVISNASLIGRADVREDLAHADWVSLKVDAVDEVTWRRVDRPHRALQLESILAGALAFSESFQGTLATETLLVGGLNDSEKHAEAVADFLARLRPATAYLSVATRPPAEAWVTAPSEDAVNRAFQIVQERVRHVECLLGYEGNAFSMTGDAREDLLAITSVHPMRSDAVEEFLARAGADDALVRELVALGELVELTYAGRTYFLRKLPGR
ncbi:MAG: radical SAM protein [Candidatus Bipolaricaulota bacterium]